ncbi:D-threonate kinase [Caviibacterium pharyngocola]|uniref:Four-carbon acid sugar kinase family protein n=1 Tax=Caviibacterium pharyngocola TaxID=28159 RepID=A0A2M8RUE3_9PAST|nr:four-carbon acid sugar kinase family protein [Caviibacterium pharyngocola]PJG82510.1 hypothetical protein CVP04_09255 [Caviibacterium pharyngocola]
MKLFVIADDFTGANDTGVQFSLQGLSVDVMVDFSQSYDDSADVIVVNTDSRAMTIENAQKSVYQVISSQPISACIYKKIDSTLRGNIGAEIESCLQAAQRKLALFCPALPKAGRTIKNGICYVHNQPLIETEFATDPKTPIISSDVRQIIAAQTAIPQLRIHLDLLRQSDCLSIIKENCSQNSSLIVCFDAENEQDLQRINQIAAQLNEPHILVGSSGLAQSIFSEKRPHFDVQSALPIFFVIGSMSEKTRRQAEYVAQHSHLTPIVIPTESLLRRDSNLERIKQKVIHRLREKHHVLLQTDNSLAARENIDTLCRQYQLDRATLGEMICQELSKLSAAILTEIHFNIGGLFLTGGDIAVGVAKKLGGKRYRIGGEIESGVPFGYFPSTPFSHIPIITKAGGFGSETVLWKTIDFIQNKVNRP